MSEFNYWLAEVLENYGKEYTLEVDAAFYGYHKYYRNDPSRRRETGFKESQLAYSVIREMKPNVVWDVGCGDGGSTYPLLCAIKKNEKGVVYAFEAIYERYENATRNLVEFKDRVRLTPGDIREIALPEGMDILFLDATHEATFAEWHVATLWPRATFIHVHDVYYGDHPTVDERAVVLKALEADGYDAVPDHTLLGSVGADARGPGSANSGIWIRRK